MQNKKNTISQSQTPTYNITSLTCYYGHLWFFSKSTGRPLFCLFCLSTLLTIIHPKFVNLYNTTALYNFYAASEVDKTSLHKACTKSVGFFADWALETKVPKNISRCICQLIWLRSSCGLVFWYFAK